MAVATRPYGLLSSLLFILVFGAIGVSLLFHSHAQTACAPSTSMPTSGCRPFLGAAVNRDPWLAGGSTDKVAQYNGLESLVGDHIGAAHPFSIYRDFNSSTTGSLTLMNPEEVRINKQSPTTYLDINWQPTSTWLAADGGNQAINTEIATAAGNIKAAGKPVFLTVGQEPQHSVSGWDPGAAGQAEQSYCNSKGLPHFPGTNGSAGTPAQYIAMWKNVEGIFKAHGVTNVIWTMDYQGYPALECLTPALWPESKATVNWLFYDTYARTSTDTFDSTAGRYYDYLASKPNGVNLSSVPWGIGEMNSCPNTSYNVSAQYWLEAATAVKNNTYPNLKLYSAYDDAGGPVSGPACLTNVSIDSSGNITSDPTGLKEQDFETFAKAVLGDTSGTPPTPSVSFTVPAAGTTVSGNAVSVAAKASVSPGTITSLTLKAGATTLKTCSNMASCATSWNTTGLSNGTYTLGATTTASDGKTAAASETVTVHNGSTVTLTAPTNLTSPAQTTTSISLAWHASQDSTYAASRLAYHLYRNGKAVGTTKAGTTSYTDTGLSPGTYYSYTITASDPGGHISTQSAALAVSTKKPNCPAPTAPKGLAAHATAPTAASLSWQAVANPSKACTIAHYVVERAGVALAQPTTPSYTDTSLTPSTTYRYTVLAVATGNIAGSASTVTVTTPVSHTPDPGPSAPAHLAVTPVSPTQVNLTWSASIDRVTGIKQYRILRDGKQVGTTTTTSFGDSGLYPHTSYTYQVVAVSGGDKPAGSAAVHVTTLSTSSSAGAGTSASQGESGGAGSSASSIPLLQGTTSVGSGSDTGTSTSQNPTAAGSSTASSLTGKGTTPSHGSSFRRVADVAGGSLVGVAVLAGTVWLFWWRPRRYPPANPDPDLYAATVVRPNPNNDSNKDKDKEHQP